ncbi:MAG: outer membrane receptor for ferrienterochelin and colicins, partial [Glaciecola sp.]
MNLNSKYFLLYFSLFFSFISLAQEKQETVKDSLKVEKLEEVVVTGQINPQSVE